MTDIFKLEIESTEKPLFELNFKRKVPPLSPRSIAELRQWLAVERAYWSWIDTVSKEVPELQRQTANDSEIEQALKEAAQSKPGQSTFDSAMEKCVSMLQKRYDKVQALHSTSPRAKFLETIDDPVTRGHALRYFINLMPAPAPHRRAIEGAFLAFSFDHGIKDGVPDGYQRAFQDTQHRVATEHESLRRRAGEIDDRYRELKASVESLHSSQKEDYERLAGERTVKFTKLVDDSNAKVADLERAFEEKTATKFAVVYFQNKAKSHWIGTVIFAAVTLVAGCWFGNFAIDAAQTLLSDDKPKIGKIAVAVLLATLGFWLLRLLVRSLLSQMHLATDCQSRATLMETYIALLKDGQGELKGDDRKIILNVLFRPMSDGLIRDDGAPPGVWDLLTRVLGGNK